MDNFKLIYQILRWLERSMDCECPDYTELSAERFRVSEPRFRKVMPILAEEGPLVKNSACRNVNLSLIQHPRRVLFSFVVLKYFLSYDIIK